MGRPVFIIHFQPLELYPPVMNLLNSFGTFREGGSFVVLSTHSTRKAVSNFEPGNKKIKIIRLGKTGSALPVVIRYLNYIYFYASSLLLLMLYKPAAILYYETLSSYPVYLYKKYFSRRVPLFIHYHEYTSASEYQTGMKLVSFFHSKEKKLYPKADWISHTNEGRLACFLVDEKLADRHNTYVLPNYPPKSWNHKPAFTEDCPLKIVYAGALSTDTMYTEVFANWVHSQNGKVVWDIYSNNVTDEAISFLKKMNSGFIRLLNGVDYAGLGKILPLYRTGVILYNGHIPNYVLNAPNKLFEYLACGLDVWFPDAMTGCLPYCTSKTYPIVMPLDFQNEDSFHIDTLTKREGYTYKPSSYFYENIYPVLIQKIMESIE